MGEIDRAAIRARIEHCKAYRFGMLGVIAGQDAPALLAALGEAERERDALAAAIEQVRALLDIEEFNRWIAKRDAEVAAKALEEAAVEIGGSYYQLRARAAEYRKTGTEKR